MIWTEDIATEKVLEKTEYFVYCGFFKMNFWDERFVQIAKGEFLEVPCSLSYCFATCPVGEGLDPP